MNAVIIEEIKVKRLYCIFIIVIAIITSSFCSIAVAEGKEEINSEEMKILNQFPDYHLLSLNELDSLARDFFSEKFQNEIPGIVKSDFNGDGYQDYAMLLRNNNFEKAKLVILFCSAVSPCKNIYELDVKNLFNTVYLRPVKQGTLISQTDAIDTKKYSPPVKLKYNGVRLTYVGKGEIVLYWNDNINKMQTIQTSD